MMNPVLLALALVAASNLNVLLVDGFAFVQHPSSKTVTNTAFGADRISLVRRSSSITEEETTETITTTDWAKRNFLLKEAMRLKEENGVFLIDAAAKEDLTAAVTALEDSSVLPPPDEFQEKFLGDWTLLCTTASDNQGINSTSIPLWNVDVVKQTRDTIRKAANKYIGVVQSIRSETDGVIDRVDNIITYEPPSALADVLDTTISEQLSKLNLNPFGVSKSQVSLIHKATIDPSTPYKTKLVLKSSVLNVAGTASFLDPYGQDLVALNFPFGDAFNAGDFETTYIDDKCRISRGKQGPFNQLRVFVRSNEFNKEAPVDVDAVVDPEFVKASEEPEVSDDVGPSD